MVENFKEELEQQRARELDLAQQIQAINKQYIEEGFTQKQLSDEEAKEAAGLIINGIGEVRGNLFNNFNESHEPSIQAAKQEEKNRAALGLPIHEDYEIARRIGVLHDEHLRLVALGDKYQHLAKSKLAGLSPEELQEFVAEQEKEAAPIDAEIEENDLQM